MVDWHIIHLNVSFKALRNPIGMGSCLLTSNNFVMFSLSSHTSTIKSSISCGCLVSLLVLIWALHLPHCCWNQ